MVKFSVAIAILASCVAASALPQSDDATDFRPYPGTPPSSENWCGICGGPTVKRACPEKEGLKCCFIKPDVGVCLPYCPEDFQNPLARREFDLRNAM